MRGLEDKAFRTLSSSSSASASASKRLLERGLSKLKACRAKKTFDYVYEDVETAIEFKLHTLNFNFFALKFLIFEYTNSYSNKFNFLLFFDAVK